MSQLQEKLENTIGEKISSPSELNDMCGYIYWAGFAGLELRFTVSDEVYQLCLEYGDTKMYHVSYGHDELWKLGSHQFLNNL